MAPEPEDGMNEKNPRPLDEDDIALLKTYVLLFLPHFHAKLISWCRVDRNKYQIQIPLPPKIDPSVTMMTVEEKPDVTYNDVGGCKEQIEKMREVWPSC
ncbi:hypothetical protein GW17_00026351 [Ensete ventricosum]|nr:hypothetical protein GW17_00026351 [Ensete ventricosum]